MPRPRRPGAPEPKRRSRKGCWPCKARKVKCGEEKPSCLNCRRQNEPCDYSIRLNWGGRTRRRSSVDSPSSQSSGQSGQFILAFSPSDMMQPDSTLLASPYKDTGSLGGDTAGDHVAERLFWEAGYTGEMAIGTSYPRGLYDIHESSAIPDQSLNPSTRTTGKSSVDMSPPSPGKDAAASWSGLSPNMTTVVSREAAPSYPSSITHSLDDFSYPSPADTGSSIGSFAPFTFSPATMSQPNSFLRHAADVPEQPLSHSSPGQGGTPDQGYPHSQYSSPTDVVSAYAPYQSQSPSDPHEGVSPLSKNPQLLASSSVVQDTESIPAGVASNSEDFFNKIMNSPVLSEDHPQVHTSEPLATGHPKLSSMDHEADVPGGLSSAERKWHAYLTSVTDNYGLDCGRPDLDLNKNDDHSAIDINYALDLINSQSESSAASNDRPGNSSSAELKPISLDGAKFAYYASPVPINIPRYLSPLPPTLVQTPINLMYFHHFINHTARMLVPHDCSDNPFVSVLPSMAIGDSNLLNLMLAYSASHRARYLEHPEPATRIAHLVSNVFPALRLALEDPHEKVTDNHLATAIMLLSLKIISPSTFEVPIPWQSHLKLARELFLARQEQMTYPGNRIGPFLARWLGYLDIMGTLSCRHTEPPLSEYYSLISTCCSAEGLDEYCVDCFSGFTPRTGLFLTRLAKLVHQCDNERFDEMGIWISGWRPSASIILEAQELINELELLRTRAHASSRHFRESGATDIIASDKTFYYAGLLHLHRRVLGTSPFSTPVKEALDGLREALAQIRFGASAEVGTLFCLFTAGCEALDPGQRMEIQERFEVLEKTGMKQIQHARKLMQRCWDENMPWIALARGEFLG
ncbi:fungal-specific transcription factor domain-containing protein [Aspergillus pseudocaelatus]|uniref:Fungal-specific transcription factor domain-containing protein n=1 Tax=Aspergillus pseudocaelatus TaxID=1825620 RepID=A0ABQ6WQS8_9EURO|nr:fungal-specific transcription factor domain-containing protein [Aspergillus pseudocaelatus]